MFVKLHSEIQAHATENVANFSQRLLTKILGRQHFALRTLHEISNSLNTGVLQAIVRTDGQLEFVNRSIELIVARQGRALSLLVAVIFRVFFKVNKDRHVIFD